jgi:hypothetical protein
VTHIISKSKYLSGLQCPKLLWCLVRDKENIPSYSEATEAIFEQGHQVGVLAQQLFPGGISIPWEAPPSEKLALTQEALRAKKPIYEATFSAAGAYAQVDILVPDGARWNIVEVKSTTSVKDINLHDLSLQRHACEAAGIGVGKCILAHLNREYERQGELDIDKLFTLEDVTAEASELLKHVPAHLRQMNGVLTSDSMPETPIGTHCSDPYACVLKERCSAFLPEHSVFDLYRGGRKAWDLLEVNTLSMSEIGERIDLTDKQAVQVASVKAGQPHVDKPAIREFLQGLNYPLSFLDFETFQSAVPKYDGTRPYQQIPFQFSLHVVDSLGATPVHHAWLAQGQEDPRGEFLATLQQVLGSEGDIIAYNIGFEKARLKELGVQLPVESKWVEQINARFVDLITPFRDFDYYHPEQHGSCSLKYVLPALTGTGYAGMEIADGTAAVRAFLRVEHADVSPEERAATRADMEAYCEQDTLGMIWILSRLDEVSC